MSQSRIRLIGRFVVMAVQLGFMVAGAHIAPELVVAIQATAEAGLQIFAKDAASA